MSDAASRPASGHPASKCYPVSKWHRVPNTLTDEVMPRLKDTELRVLLVVLRQTWGWRAAPGERQRKRRDWLSHRQLCRRTGRGSEAVSGAVASLVAEGLLAVEDAAGALLTTPDERRRCLGRLYFRPGDGLGKSVLTPGVEKRGGVWKTARMAPSGKTENNKDTNKQNKWINNYGLTEK